MREIKVRAWNKDKKFMVEPFRLQNLTFVFASNKAHVYMQYTGLKDKNEKEIYESDFIKGHGIGFSTTHSEVYLGVDGAQVKIGDHWIQLSNFKEREIIGNKYEK